MLVYGVDSRKSFEHVECWHTEVMKHAPINTQILIVANKCDLLSERKVSTQEGKVKGT